MDFSQSPLALFGLWCCLCPSYSLFLLLDLSHHRLSPVGGCCLVPWVWLVPIPTLPLPCCTFNVSMTVAESACCTASAEIHFHLVATPFWDLVRVMFSLTLLKLYVSNCMGNNVLQTEMSPESKLLAKVISSLKYKNFDVWVKSTGLKRNIFITCQQTLQEIHCFF